MKNKLIAYAYLLIATGIAYWVAYMFHAYTPERRWVFPTFMVAVGLFTASLGKAIYILDSSKDYD